MSAQPYPALTSPTLRQDIFRRYPNRYESIIATLCDNLESLDEPEAKASMIWIIGGWGRRRPLPPATLGTCFVEPLARVLPPKRPQRP